jgi:hypothetical protein
VTCKHDRGAESRTDPFTSAIESLIGGVPLIGRLPDLRSVNRAVLRPLYFEAAAKALTERAAHTRLLLIVDDLQHASALGSHFFQYIIRACPTLSVLAVVNDSRSHLESQVTQVIATVRAESLMNEVPLGPLLSVESDELIEALGGSQLKRIHEVAKGNPLIIVILLRIERVDRFLLSDPTKIEQEIVRELLRELSAPTIQILELAAVLGNNFDERTIESAFPGVKISRSLEEANGRLIERVSTRGDWKFLHSRVDESIHTSIDPTRRSELHRRALDALEALSSNNAEALVQHASEVLDLHPERLLNHWLQAGRMAIERFDFSQARHCATVATRNRAFDNCSLELRSDLWALAARSASDENRSKKFFALRAAEAAEAAGDSRRLTEASDLYGEWIEVGQRDLVGEELCDRALRSLSHDDHAARARLLARKAMTLLWSTSSEIAEQANQNIESAKWEAGLADDLQASITVADVICVQLQASPDIRLRRGEADRLTQLTGAAHWLEALATLSAGDWHGYERTRKSLLRSPFPFDRAMATHWEAMNAILIGEWSTAENCAAQALAHFPNEPNFQNMF